MIAIRMIFLAAACAVALSACASAPPAPAASPASPTFQTFGAKAPPPAGASGVIQPVAAAAPAYGTANTGGTYPYGTIQNAGLETPQQPLAATAEEIVVLGPDGTVWLRSTPSDTAYQGDVDSCYSYARGQIAHDVRIENDVGAAFQSEAGGLGLAALRGRMNRFERSNRMPSLFSSCMTAKGYSNE